MAGPALGEVSALAWESLQRGAGLGALLAARDYPEIRATLALDAGSRVLLLGSEGDTDPAIYRRVVGRSAQEVLA
jgi:diaminopropionate ammonia-lyase